MRAWAAIWDAFAIQTPSRLRMSAKTSSRVADPVRMADQPGMQIQNEVPASFRAVGKKLIEGIGDGLTPALGADASVPHRDHVVELQRHRERDERLWTRMHEKRLLVVRPIERIFDAQLGQKRRGPFRLTVFRAMPADRPHTR